MRLSQVGILKFTSIVAVLLGMSPPSLAQLPSDGMVNAGYIMSLTSEQRVLFLAGVIDGLAYARFVADGKKTDGMNCVYGWFASKDNRHLEVIHEAFKRRPDFLPSAIVSALVERACPR